MPVEKPVLLAMMSAAVDRRNNAYAPYSGFRVGAAVLGGSGKVYWGSNVENASYGLTVCAERVAIFRAVSDGESEIRAVVVCTGEGEPPVPCGACLQVMAEFAPKNEPLTIVACSGDGTYTVADLEEYLPRPFTLNR
ncbi:MAG: cytidine deaminase [Armatimonadota bacterium]